MNIGFCIIEAISKPPAPPAPPPLPLPPPPPPPPRDRKTSLKLASLPPPPAGVDRVDSEVDADGIRDLALSRPDFRLALLGSRSSPCWNAFADPS